MTDEAEEPSGRQIEPNGQFTIFHALILAIMIFAIVLPAHDGYKADGVRGLLFGLLGGVFLLAPIGLVLGTVGVIAFLGTVFAAAWLIESLTGWWRGRSGAAIEMRPAPPQLDDEGS